MSGKTWKWVHFFMIFFFIILWIAAGVFGWVKSVTFVSHMSMLALVLAEISAWQGARTEEKEDQRD